MPLAATKPSPGSFSTVTVKVWDSVMLFVALAAILMRASTQRLAASWLAAVVASVDVLIPNDRLPKVTVVEAVPVVVPVDAEVNLTVQTPEAFVPSSQVESVSGESSTTARNRSPQ